MTRDHRKTPFPYFGGKAGAAAAVWAALGDVPHYVEPFFGSGAVLFRRPHEPNFWRALQLWPDELAEAASWPVSEADLHARHLRLLRWRAENDLERLMGDPLFCDVQLAGWWVWGQSAWIGSGWCSGQGPWVLGEGGRITRRQSEGRKPGVKRQVPFLATDGMGMHSPQLREPGVSRQIPHLGNDGKGMHSPKLREPGVSRQIPHLGDDGKGMHSPQPGVGDFHPMTMPELRRWFEFLRARLRHVRILNGDWSRAVGSGASLTLSVRTGHGPCGVFLDPPYRDYEDLYSAVVASKTAPPRAFKKSCNAQNIPQQPLSDAVRAWALLHGADPRYRIVLAGFSGEHDEMRTAGWEPVEWFARGYLRGGYGVANKQGHQQHRERLWISPHCLRPAQQQDKASTARRGSTGRPPLRKTTAAPQETP